MIENNIRYCREELEMTQSELGYVFGVSKYTVSGWETGKDTMPFNKLIKFCNLYDYSLDFVLGLNRKNIKYGTDINIAKKQIGIKLKEVRKSLNLTQQKLSDECGFFQTTYSGYETGRYLINTITIYTICKKYNISMDWICGKSKKMYIV